MPWLLIVIGVAAFVYLWRLGETGRAAEGWPPVVGEVIASGVDVKLRAGGGEASARETYKATVRYRYRYGTQVYESATLAFPEPGYGQSRAQAAARAERYPVGAQVKVYVNPAQPTQACLEAGRHWTVWGGLLLCLGFVVAGLALVSGRI